MTKFRYSRTTWMDRYVPFGLFAGQASGVILLVASLLLMGASGLRPTLFHPVRDQLTTTLAPTLGVVSQPFQNLTQLLDYLWSLSRLKSEVEKLRLDKARLEEWYNTAQLLQAENKSLRDLLRVQLAPSLTFFTTRVIGETTGPYAQNILIAAGTDDGVQKGDAVLSGQGLLGRVIETTPHTAQVLLITDLTSRIPVRLDNSMVNAILAPTEGSILTLQRLPEGTSVRPNTKVLTSGIGGVFPPDIPVGITAVDTKGRTTVQPFADFGRLLFVRVVKQPREREAP